MRDEKHGIATAALCMGIPSLPQSLLNGLFWNHEDPEKVCPYCDTKQDVSKTVSHCKNCGGNLWGG